MFNIILKTSCNKYVVYILNRQFHPSGSLLARRKMIPKIHPNAGIRNLEKVHQDDPDCLNSLEDEYDETSEAINFMHLDKAYDDHFREKKWNRTKLERIITSKHFFTQKTNPAMLTFAEKEHMKFLHNSDPIQWDVKTLSENFPATIDVVKKILKSKWKGTPERQKKMDEAVEKNWELLAEGKLDADLEVIEHCKKFLNNRKIILERIKKSEFYLPEVKRDKIYNNNEMSNIIYHYEKCIENLEKEFESKQRSDANLPVNKTSSLELIYDKIKKEEPLKNLKNEETFLLNKKVNSYQKNVTLEELEKDVLTKAENNKSLNLQEKAILEKKLNDISKNNKNEDFLESNKGNFETIKIQSNGLNLYHQSIVSPHLEKGEKENSDNFLTNKQKSNMFFNKECSFSIDQKQSEIQNIPFIHDVSGDEINLQKIQSFTKENESSLINEVKITSGVIKEKENPHNVVEEKDSFWVTSRKKDNTYVKAAFKKNNENLKHDLTNHLNEMEAYVSKDSPDLNSESTMKNIQSESENSLENLNNMIDDDVIENTAFWNNNYKPVAENQNPSLESNKIFKNITTKYSENDEAYPLKIIIPKEKRRPGLTYKLKDCYYDDDGRFLYRVPGMTK